ncbi:GNAT family N-acetyltransferase [Poritiphilus flavus]|uniref:GNAT family N-acetyltransferase n=1 Tax=Poritiphilus flavus TaxID=2697053 RepID=A0A6L9EF17_9FLAO|nr:GNAT family N-acetyltransferase [Poritiphilus flavus]NAS13337.1 GNAT family N-acetyltransferase [Poritiphilus flavus]
MILIKEVKSKMEYHLASKLFREYAEQLGIDLSFQEFDREIQDLEAQYSHPHGTIFVALDTEDNAMGCIAIRKLENSICELKRMYVKPGFRGLGVGQKLLAKSLKKGKSLGYDTMRLDTLASMEKALALYTKAGFYEIPPYRYNPVEGAKYFEIDLNSL